MNATISIIFVLSLCASVGAQASARQRDEQIRKACAPREYVTSVQDYVKAQKQLSEARPGEIALETLLNRKSSEKQVASGSASRCVVRWCDTSRGLQTMLPSAMEKTDRR
jgi:hypothetical protein